MTYKQLRSQTYKNIKTLHLLVHMQQVVFPDALTTHHRQLVIETAAKFAVEKNQAQQTLLSFQWFVHS